MSLNIDVLFRFMNDFDRAMMHLDKAFGFVAAPHQYVSRKDEGDKLIVVERGDLVMVFNFHPTNSYTDYRVGCLNPGPYKLVLSSDEEVFGGYKNVTKEADVEFYASQGDFDGRPLSFQVRLCLPRVCPARLDQARLDRMEEGAGRSRVCLWLCSGSVVNCAFRSLAWRVAAVCGPSGQAFIPGTHVHTARHRHNVIYEAVVIVVPLPLIPCADKAPRRLIALTRRRAVRAGVRALPHRRRVRAGRVCRQGRGRRRVRRARPRRPWPRALL
jgi:Alpha amylase, C-terminal all-beta domain